MRKIGKDSIQHPDFMLIEQDDRPYFYEERELAEVDPHVDAGKVNGGEWRPIGVSTPRDRVILAWGNNWHWEGIEKAYLHSDYNGHKNVICRGGLAGVPFTLGRPDAPTHWRPLPSAPTSEVGK